VKLDAASLKPLYMQLKDVLEADIMSGKYQAGEQLPSEPELCRVYGVSRITTRRAILDLVEEGILHRQQGKGTFVTEGKMKRELICVNGFSRSIQQMGKVPHIQILSSKVMMADQTIADMLAITEEAIILKLHRLHFLDYVPLALETGYYSLERFPNLEKYIGESISTYDLLKQQYQVQPACNRKTINIRPATSEAADLLQISQGESLFEMEEQVFSKEGRPIHYSISLLPANRVTFTLS
jgi:GntR family frlABCD operon transcriptional regulator